MLPSILQNLDPRVIAGASFIIALSGLSWKAVESISTRRKQARLRRAFGADIYDADAIERAVAYYVEPNCTSVDPAQEAEPRNLVVAEQALMEVVDKFVATESEGRHLVVLADSGMGKSAFVINYWARNSRRRLRECARIAIVHLGLPDSLARIQAIENKRETVLFLDAFDEDTKAIGDHRARIVELMVASREFRRVVLTSRTQFFPSEEELPRDTGILRIEPRGLAPASYEFRKAYLAPLTDHMVKLYLEKRFPIFEYRKRRKAAGLVSKVPLLSVRPMLLTHIPDLLDEDASIKTSYQLYDVLVRKWYEREATWVKPANLDKFSKRLAVDLFVNREKRGAERLSGEELVPLAKKWKIDLEEWQLRGRSLLNRDALGNYKFAHRSMLEFLLAKVIVEDTDADKPSEPLLELMNHMSERLVEALSLGQPIAVARPVMLSQVLTDQTRAFLADVAGLPENFLWGPGRYMRDEELDALVARARERAQQIAEKVVPKDDRVHAVRLIGPPIYDAVHGGPVSDYLIDAIIVDRNAELQWKVVLGRAASDPATTDRTKADFARRTQLKKEWRRPTRLDVCIATGVIRERTEAVYASGASASLSDMMVGVSLPDARELARELIESAVGVRLHRSQLEWVTVLVRPYKKKRQR